MKTTNVCTKQTVSPYQLLIRLQATLLIVTLSISCSSKSLLMNDDGSFTAAARDGLNNLLLGRNAISEPLPPKPTILQKQEPQSNQEIAAKTTLSITSITPVKASSTSTTTSLQNTSKAIPAASSSIPVKINTESSSNNASSGKLTRGKTKTSESPQTSAGQAIQQQQTTSPTTTSTVPSTQQQQPVTQTTRQNQTATNSKKRTIRA